MSNVNNMFNVKPVITLKPVTSPLNDISLPSGGVILKSSDGVEFKVYKNILALASPFFRQMFTLPQPSSPDAGKDRDSNPGPEPEVSVIKVSETSTALDILLRLIYPIAPPQFPGTSESGQVTDAKKLVNGIEPVLAAALKYDMTLIVKELCARLLTAAETTLPDGSVIDETLALRVFVLACRHGLKAEARRAAHASLKGRVAGAFIDELRSITAAQYFHLIQFHTKVSTAVDLFIQSMNNEHVKCPLCGNSSPEKYSRWWTSFVTSARPILQKSPKSTTVFHGKILADMLNTAQNCSMNPIQKGCSSLVHGKWQTVSQLIREAVDRAIVEHDINLSEI